MDEPCYYVVTGATVQVESNFTAACLILDQHYESFGVNRAAWPPGGANPEYVGYIAIEQNGEPVGRIDYANARFLVEEYRVWETVRRFGGSIPNALEQSLLLHVWSAYAAAYVSMPYREDDQTAVLQ